MGAADMTDNVVAELDAILEEDGEYAYSGPVGILKRARDEIVMLQATVERQRLVLSKGHAEVRALALEEAIKAIDNISWDWPSPWIDDAETFKVAIRALKRKDL